MYKTEARYVKDDDPPSEEDEDDYDRVSARQARGVYFTHAGLLRTALNEAFGSKEMAELRSRLATTAD